MLVTWTTEEAREWLKTEEARKELERAEKMPITFDEDCPELTDEQLKQFRRVRPHKKESA